MKLVIFSRRWGHDDHYTINKTNTGWTITHMAIGGECDKKGEPFLTENLKHDSIDYPADISGYMDWLWRKSEGKEEEFIQEKLDELSEWLKVTEKSTPTSDFWKGYK